MIKTCIYSDKIPSWVIFYFRDSCEQYSDSATKNLPGSNIIVTFCHIFAKITHFLVICSKNFKVKTFSSKYGNENRRRRTSDSKSGTPAVRRFSKALRKFYPEHLSRCADANL